MSPSLTAALANKAKQKLIPATVIDVLNHKCSVRLSGSGTKLTNLSYFGPIPVVGSAVVVDYRSAGIPIVMTTEISNPPAADPTKNLGCILPAGIQTDISTPTAWPDFSGQGIPGFDSNINPIGGYIPPISYSPPPDPITPPDPGSCPDASSGTGPFTLIWSSIAISADTPAIAWENCVLRSTTAANPSSLHFWISFPQGGSPANLHVYAIDAAENILATAILTYDTYATYDGVLSYPIVATFSLVSPLAVAGFKVAFDSAYSFSPLPLYQAGLGESAGYKSSSGASIITRPIYDPTHGHIQLHTEQTLAMSGSYGNRPFAGIDFDFNASNDYGTLHAFVDVSGQCDTGNWNIDVVRLLGWNYSVWNWISVGAQSFSYKGLFTVPRQIGTPYGQGPRETVGSRRLQIEPVGFPYWNPPTATFSGRMTVDFYWTNGDLVPSIANLGAASLMNVCP